MTEAIRNEAGLDYENRYTPFILAIVGPPLHGKTTLARELAKNSNLQMLDVDEARAALFPDRVVGHILPAEQERFAMLTSYQFVHESARDVIHEGRPVVIAGAYTREIYHLMLYELARSAGVPLKTILLECTEDEIQRRLGKRNGESTLSNVHTFEQYLSIKNRYRRIQKGEITVFNSEVPTAEAAELLSAGLSKFRVYDLSK